jgi:hypothetical protein
MTAEFWWREGCYALRAGTIQVKIVAARRAVESNFAAAQT